MELRQELKNELKNHDMSHLENIPTAALKDILKNLKRDGSPMALRNAWIIKQLIAERKRIAWIGLYGTEKPYSQ